MPNALPNLDEKASERMNFRTRPHIKQTIQRAAALRGMDDSTFTMSAAYAEALETIAAHERTLLSPVDHAVLFEALEAPPEPNEKLRAAHGRHRQRVQTK